MNTIKSKNKLLAAITAMLLIASTALAVVPMANAISAPTLYYHNTSGPVLTSGNVGDVVYVYGTDASAGTK
jgi:hypothetical protein